MSTQTELLAKLLEDFEDAERVEEAQFKGFWSFVRLSGKIAFIVAAGVAAFVSIELWWLMLLALIPISIGTFFLFGDTTEDGTDFAAFASVYGVEPQIAYEYFTAQKLRS